MGGPSQEELSSNEFVSKYVDNEFENKIERSFFENLLKVNFTVIDRVEQQSAVKLAISELFSVDNLQPSDAVRSEIRKLVNASLNKVGINKIQDTEDEFENIRQQDDRFIISQYVDEELDLNSFSEKDIEEIIKSSQENKRFYHDLLRTKNLTKSLFDTKSLEPTDKVASPIRNLVASMDATERDNRPDINMSMKYDTRFEEQLQPTARVSLPVSNNSSKNSESDPWDKVGLEETDRKTSKVTWLSFKKYSMPSVQQLASLAAVFAFGVVIAPTLYETVKPQSDADRIVLRGGSDTQLMADNNNELISFKQDRDESLEIRSLTAGPEPVEPNTPFTLQFIAPISGDVSIYVNASVEKDRKLVLQGQKYDLGYFDRNSIIKFPENGALKVDEADQLLRVDFSVSDMNEDIFITRWFTIGHGLKEIIKSGE